VIPIQDAAVNGPRADHRHDEPHFIPRYAERIAAAKLPQERALVKKGWAFVWAANLAPGGSPVTDPGSTRRSLVTHWYFEDCLYFTPMTSDPAGGRLSLRAPLDVKTGRWRWPRRDGKVVFPGLKPWAFSVLELIRRQPRV